MGNRRIWWGLGIMAVGLCAAWPFRKTWLQEQDAFVADALSPASAESWPLQPAKLTHVQSLETSPASESPVSDDLSSGAGLHPIASALERGIDRRPLARLDENRALPALAGESFAAAAFPAVDPRAAILGAEGSTPVFAEIPPPMPQRRHRIGKHDTLRSIAERYLGSPQHADKLLAANADVILVPEVLPVGATIVIPEIGGAPQTLVRLPEGER